VEGTRWSFKPEVFPTWAPPKRAYLWRRRAIVTIPMISAMPTVVMATNGFFAVSLIRAGRVVMDMAPSIRVLLRERLVDDESALTTVG
jgi:hypothetical protein